MLRRHIFFMSLFLGAVAALTAQDNGKLQSGPKAGAFMPGSFESFNLNGAAKGRPHCLVCGFGLRPVVLVFAKDPADGKDDGLNELLTKLDEAATEFESRAFSVGVVYLSPDARDSTNNAQEKDAQKIIDEAIAREKLHARLTKQAEKFKNVIVACHPPEGPKKYDLNPKAEVTVLFYERMKISDTWAFGAAELDGKNVDAIVKKVRETLPLKKKADDKELKG